MSLPIVEIVQECRKKDEIYAQRLAEMVKIRGTEQLKAFTSSSR